MAPGVGQRAAAGLLERLVLSERGAAALPAPQAVSALLGLLEADAEPQAHERAARALAAACAADEAMLSVVAQDQPGERGFGWFLGGGGGRWTGRVGHGCFRAACPCLLQPATSLNDLSCWPPLAGFAALLLRMQQGAPEARRLLLQLVLCLTARRQDQQALLRSGVVQALLALFKGGHGPAVSEVVSKALENLSQPASSILERSLSGRKANGAEASASAGGEAHDAAGAAAAAASSGAQGQRQEAVAAASAGGEQMARAPSAQPHELPGQDAQAATQPQPQQQQQQPANPQRQAPPSRLPQAPAAAEAPAGAGAGEKPQPVTPARRPSSAAVGPADSPTAGERNITPLRPRNGSVAAAVAAVESASARQGGSSAGGVVRPERPTSPSRGAASPSKGGHGSDELPRWCREYGYHCAMLRLHAL